MAKKKQNPVLRTRRWEFEEIFLCLCAVLSVILTWFASKYCIDSDASSELVLANHLAENGGILTADWGYSTELRVLNTQLVYAPLLKIFSDWRMVRFFGALILQAILVGSYYVFTKATGISKKIFCISAGLCLLPISVCYGRIFPLFPQAGIFKGERIGHASAYHSHVLYIVHLEYLVSDKCCDQYRDHGK